MTVFIASANEWPGRPHLQAKARVLATLATTLAAMAAKKLTVTKAK